jgi:hypothetical protein
MNPFDWRYVVLAKHAQHVVLIHFPIAMFILILWSWWLHFRARRTVGGIPPLWRFPVEFAGVLLLIITGHLGGFLSGVNGVT